MTEKFLDRLATRLAKSAENSGTPEDFTFAELSDIDWDKISAAHDNNHASNHYDSP